MNNRRSAYEAVFVLILKDDQVLMHKRKNTGWMDGWYDLPSGHVEPNEAILTAAVREAKEETGIDIEPEDMEFFHLSQADTNKTYTYFAFRTRKWRGEPRLTEPELAEELKFYPLDNLPKKISAYTKAVINNVNSDKITYSYFGAADFE